MQMGAGVRETAEDNALQRWRRQQGRYRRRNRDAGGAIGGEMIDAGGDGGKGDRGKSACPAESDRAGVAGGKQLILALVAAMPDRSHRMDHMLGRQAITFGDLGIAGGAAIK